MAELSTIARPYAKAAFDFAIEKNAVESWAEMLSFAAQVSENETMKPLLSGALSSSQLADLFIKVCGEQINEQGQNLIKVMAENGRLEVLPAVYELFHEFSNEWAKEVEASVVSATELSAEQQQQISASLEKRLTRKVKLNCSVDASLVAGVIITAGDLVIDGSVSGKLNRLSEKLQS
ncbi:F0F1 ATP synthase subunit delta [Shewanella loihica]|uniref:ATP synthase subunit delta n=1 Tax=Shewanella loihica (strain ATCC BAA-1088 / PV-4) TaxID=323850 RepID=ATPD_SHELP|nr:MULTISPECIES: F0F1 ATP synthase subunit delta [Shewanella]A3QJR3.1 RecName: Full=ATP synthase subunit delta; AltName: Full=ATP synthase F(1) sector subunit delta; AltName: Full=F-type ATPase subunit delta; Short=F-ATPase subunit delta [Shewanella loihica PV-4]ABO25711.1 ATP synthase F1, delta subunit [Shewanella loihica PV-4]QYJ82450.1 F0F1 ATP synthase subunit delta [Shewanella aegiceratis]QYJ90025.1 F0F1 ATP synthase subunit delta [Shewanella halotolerans]QYJ93815.1 F0F1 ATP synthase subu